MTLIWETVACDWCGASAGDLVVEGPDLHLQLPGRFRLIRCANCGLIRQDPRLAWEALKDYYPPDFCSFVPIIDEEPSWLRRLDRRYGMWKNLRAVERWQRGGRLLDVGCGTGVFLAEAQRTGRWQVVGVEPSSAADYARRVLKARVIEGRFAEAEPQLEPASFDVITLWNVLEHFSEPTADLRRAHRLLRPGGWLIAMVPNLESLAARVFGSYWLGWELPRHLYLFPRIVLARILAELGFAVRDWRCFSGSYSTLDYSLQFWSRSWSDRFPRLARALLAIYRTLPVRLALAPPLWVLDQLRLTTLITVFCQKTSPGGGTLPAGGA
jgi:SAM-dependent methyltransferase